MLPKEVTFVKVHSKNLILYGISRQNSSCKVTVKIQVK